jgi:hypothetical protein
VSRNVWVLVSVGGAQPRWGVGSAETSQGPRKRRRQESFYRDHGGRRLPRIPTILVFLVPQREALRKRGEVWFGGEGAQVAGAISRVSAFKCATWTSNGIAGANGNESENGSENGNDGERDGCGARTTGGRGGLSRRWDSEDALAAAHRTLWNPRDLTVGIALPRVNSASCGASCPPGRRVLHPNAPAAGAEVDAGRLLIDE